MTRSRICLGVHLALLLALVPGLIYAQAGERPPANVRVAEVKIQSMAPVTIVPGTVASRNDARLSAEVPGRLVNVADVGMTVSRGDVLAQIEDTVQVLRNIELEAEVKREQASLKFLENELKRFARLAESNLAAATQLEQTRSERDVALGDLQVAQSRLAQNQDQLARTRIRAPFDGVVVERLMTFDKNKDKRLSKDELPELFQRLFDRADTNKDKFLDEAELKILAKGFGAGRDRTGGRGRSGSGGRGGDGGRPKRKKRPDME